MQRTRIGMAAVITFAALGVSARATSQETVPKELALALIRGAGDGGDILVGAIPQNLARDLVAPPGGRILGSYVSPSSVQVVMTVPGTVDSARAYARRMLVDRGWKPYEPPRVQRGGLQYVPLTSGYSTTFCRTSSEVTEGITVSASFYGYPTSLLRLTRTQVGMCQSVQVERVESVQVGAGSVSRGIMRSPFESLPPLYAPGDPRSMMQCRSPSTSGGSASQSQQVRTPMTAHEVLAYYARQLDSAGWSRQAAPDSAAAVGSWKKSTEAARDAQQVTITVAPMPNLSGCYNVSLAATYDIR